MNIRKTLEYLPRNVLLCRLWKAETLEKPVQVIFTKFEGQISANIKTPIVFFEITEDAPQLDDIFMSQFA